MAKNKLVNKLSKFTDDCTGIDIFFIDHEDKIYRTDIRNEELDDSRIEFIKSFKAKYINNEQFTVPFLSNCDDRKHALYSFDFDERPLAFNLVEEIMSLSILEREKVPVYQTRENRLSGVKAVVLILKDVTGLKVAFYQHVASVSILKSDKNVLNLTTHKTRIVKLEQDILKINSNFVFMKFDDEFYIENVNTLENQLNFKKVIHQRASLYAEEILEMKFSDNMDLLVEKVEEDTSFARKLVKVCRNSAVIEKKIKTEDLIKFVKDKEAYQNVLKFNEDETLFDLKSIQRCRKFLDLLDDAFLQSELTNESYIAKAKDRVIARKN